MELAVALGGSRHATLRFTDRADGDLAVDGPEPELTRRRAEVLAGPWVWVRQVHGDAVLVVPPDEVPATAGTEADAVITAAVGTVVAVHTADCAPVALVAQEGLVGAVHAGWRGLEAGVVQRSVAEMRRLGGHRITGYLGPCIGPECYEFGSTDLARLVRRYGDRVSARTGSGAPALDLRRAVHAALAEVDVELAFASSLCTACEPSLYSHRGRRDRGRQALAVRLGWPGS